MNAPSAILSHPLRLAPRRRLREALAPFSVDLRSAALYRVALGAIVAAVFADAAIAFTATPEARAGLTAPLVALAATLGLLAVAALALLFGWASRSAAVLAAVAYAALHLLTAAPFAPGGAALLAALLWACVLPTGERFAVDTAIHGSAHKPDRFTGVATVGLALQLLALYLVPAALGDHAPLRSVTPLARSIEALPWWLGSVAYVEVAEALSFGLLIAGLAFAGRTRAFAAFALAVLHTAFAIALHLGLVHFVLAALWLALLPSGTWDWLARRVWSGDRLRVRLWHADRDETQTARVRLLQTFLLLPPSAARPTSQDVDMDVFRRQRDSWVVTDARGYRYVKFRALAAAFAASPVFWPIGYLLRIGFLETIGDWVYDLTKRRRGPLVFLATRTSPPSQGRVQEALALAILILLLAIQLGWVADGWMHLVGLLRGWFGP